MQYRYAMKICDTYNYYVYKDIYVKICNTDMRHRYAYKDMQYRYAIQICNADMQYRFAIQICNKDIQ